MAVATAIPAGVEVLADAGPAAERILTPDALDFVATLQRELGPRRDELLPSARPDRPNSTPARSRTSSRTRGPSATT